MRYRGVSVVKVFGLVSGEISLSEPLFSVAQEDNVEGWRGDWEGFRPVSAQG